MPNLPVGEPVAATAAAGRPRATDYDGRKVLLAPVRPEALIDDLYSGSHGDPETESLWTYMGYGPFADRKAMLAWLQTCADSKDPLFLSVKDRLLGSIRGWNPGNNGAVKERRAAPGAAFGASGPAG